MIGTPLYLAPEMIEMQKSGAFTDLWALGVILYEMAWGRTPFSGSTEDIVYSKILRCEIVWPNQPTDSSF